MNTFVTIACIALVASAAATPAYHYQPPKQSFRPPQHVSNSGIYSVQQSPPLASFNVQSQHQQQPQFQQNFVSSGPGSQLNAQTIDLAAPPQYAAPVQQQLVHPAPQYLAPAPVVQQQFTRYQPQQQTIISKDIFIHSAPEETEEIGYNQGAEVGPLRKNYRIVFIKAPSQNLKLNLGSLKRAQALNEEKTIIYVLSKKPDLGILQSQLAAVQPEQKAHKPEVYFIKYKTQEEANRAQQEIQAQYDSLGGSTSITDSGIAPVTSVIGGAPINIGSAGSSFSGLAAPSVSGSSGSSFNAGNNFSGPVQQQFAQQSYQSNQSATSSSVSIGSAPSQKYLPASKK